MEGWVSTTTEADDYYLNDFQFADTWNNLPVEKKEAALTSSYRTIYNSASVAVPSYTEVISADNFIKLKTAQLEMVKFIVVLAEGGIKREAALSQGIISAGIVKETYHMNARYNPKLPVSIQDILKDFSTQIGGIRFTNTNYYRY